MSETSEYEITFTSTQVINVQPTHERRALPCVQDKYVLCESSRVSDGIALKEVTEADKSCLSGSELGRVTDWGGGEKGSVGALLLIM